MNQYHYLLLFSSNELDLHHDIHCLGQVSEAGFHDISAGKAINVFPSLKAEDMLQVQREGIKMIFISPIIISKEGHVFPRNLQLQNFIFSDNGQGMRHIWRKREMHTGFRYVNLKERHDLVHLCTIEKMILKVCLKERKWEGTEWIYLAPETYQSWFLVKTLMWNRVP